MERRRDIRRLALLVLYSMDMTAEADPAKLAANLDDEVLGEHAVRPDPAVKEAAVKMAQAAWAVRAEFDILCSRLAPAWPTQRQPAIDRAILRLACYELSIAHAPVAVVINEAIELAKALGGDKSPAFVNGILDRAAREITPRPAGDAAWLADAKAIEGRAEADAQGQEPA